MESRSKRLPATLFALLIAAVAMEYLFLPVLESTGFFGGAKWNEENKRIVQMNLFRSSSCSENGIWRSQLIPVPHRISASPRILVVGDSYIWGDGYLNINDTWWRQLERELHRRGYNRCEVDAIGYRGYSLSDEIRAVKRAIQEIKPDLIVWGYTPNDADEHLIPQPGFPKMSSVRRILHKYVPENLSLFDRKILASWMAWDDDSKRPMVNADESWELSLLSGQNWEKLRSTLFDYANFITMENKPSVMVALPNFANDGYNRSRFTPIKDFLTLLNVNFLDLSRNYCAWYQSERQKLLSKGYVQQAQQLIQINPANAHPGTAVTHYYASQVADYLTSHNPQLFQKEMPPQQELDPTINDVMPPPLLTQISKIDSGYQIEIPREEHQMFMPLLQAFVQLNFAEPAKLKTIEIEGEFQDVKLYATSWDPEFKRDLGTVQELNQLTSPSKVKRWSIDSKTPINTIRIVSKFSKDQRNRKIKIRFSKDSNFQAVHA